MLHAAVMISDHEHQKPNWSLLPQPSRMREVLEIMKNVSLSEIIFQATEVTPAPSASAQSGDVMPAGN